MYPGFKYSMKQAKPDAGSGHTRLWVELDFCWRMVRRWARTGVSFWDDFGPCVAIGSRTRGRRKSRSGKRAMRGRSVPGSVAEMPLPISDQAGDREEGIMQCYGSSRSCWRRSVCCCCGRPIRISRHPIHFGAIVVCNLCLGLITPPVGTVLYVCCSIGKIELGVLARHITPMIFAVLLVLIIVTYVPQVVLFLPNLF